MDRTVAEHLKLYVGNLQYDITEEQLWELFRTQGQVESVSLVRDRATDCPKGFAFVDMFSGDEAQAAIATLNGHEFHQRKLIVCEARPRKTEVSITEAAGVPAKLPKLRSKSW